MSEGLPWAKLVHPEGEFLATPENTHLYTFIANLALYNHAYCFNVEEQIPNEEDEPRSFYIFESVDPVGFAALKAWMITNDYPAHLNLREIHNSDIEAHERATFDKLEKYWEE